jgi:hypothetical protein
VLLVSSLMFVAGSGFFGLQSITSASQEWYAVVLVMSAVGAFALGVRLVRRGIAWHRAGNAWHQPKPWTSFLTGLGSIFGIALFGLVAGSPVYWWLSATFFAFIGGVACRSIPYVLAHHRRTPTS